MSEKISLVCVRILTSHRIKLEDIAAHDKVTMSQLIRDAIKRLIAGRKAVLYGPFRCEVMVKDSFGQYRICSNKEHHDHDKKEITNDKHVK